jgi:uncharacterized protein
MIINVKHIGKSASFEGKVFRSEILNTLFYVIDWTEVQRTADHIMSTYYPNVENISQISADSLIEELKASKHYRLFVDSMNELQCSVLYISQIHGQSHIERVSVLTFAISLQNELSAEDLILCLEIAKYHDVGRYNDNEDALHGLNGAKRISQICSKFSDIEQRIIAAVIAAHSVQDNQYMQFFRAIDDLPENLYPRCKILLDILKDADALDRFRLNINSLKIEYLRLAYSQHLIKAACEIYCYCSSLSTKHKNCLNMHTLS